MRSKIRDQYHEAFYYKLRLSYSANRPSWCIFARIILKKFCCELSSYHLWQKVHGVGLRGARRLTRIPLLTTTKMQPLRSAPRHLTLEIQIRPRTKFKLRTSLRLGRPNLSQTKIATLRLPNRNWSLNFLLRIIGGWQLSLASLL